MAGATVASKKTPRILREGFPIDSLWESTARRMSKYHEVVLSGSINGRQLERRSFPTITVENFFEGKRGGAVRDLVEVLKTEIGKAKTSESTVLGLLEPERQSLTTRFQALVIFRSGIPYCLMNKGEEFEYAKLKVPKRDRHVLLLPTSNAF